MTNRVYDFTLAAVIGASQRMDVSGGYFKVLTAPGGSIGVKLDGGPEIQLMAGQGLRLPDGQSFRDVIVKNLQAVANAGTVFIGDQRFEDTRITGSVYVIDQGADKTAGGNQFFVSQSSSSALGGMILSIKATAKKVFIKRLMIGTDTAGALEYGIATGAPTSNAAAGVTPLNKLFFGGNAADASLATGTCAAIPVTAGEMPGKALIGFLSFSANQLLELPLTTPLELTPGKYFYVASGAANRSAVLIADFEEV